MLQKWGHATVKLTVKTWENGRKKAQSRFPKNLVVDRKCSCKNRNPVPKSQKIMGLWQPLFFQSQESEKYLVPPSKWESRSQNKWSTAFYAVKWVFSPQLHFPHSSIFLTAEGNRTCKFDQILWPMLSSTKIEVILAQLAMLIFSFIERSYL